MRSDLKIVAIVQARMGSTRFPGKVLMEIESKPMLWHLLNRLKHSTLINQIVVATSSNKKDIPIEEFCKEYKIDCYRGSEEDVLDRYYQAAKVYLADAVVRITADCPLIDPAVVDKVVFAYLENCDYVNGASNVIKRTYPKGLDTEVLSYLALEKTWKLATQQYEREHVTIFLYEHSELFRLYSVENDKNISDLRWTVDEESDLRFVRQVYRRLYRDRKFFFMDDILNMLEKEPQLVQINKNIKQKDIK